MPGRVAWHGEDGYGSIAKDVIVAVEFDRLGSVQLRVMGKGPPIGSGLLAKHARSFVLIDKESSVR